MNSNHISWIAGGILSLAAIVALLTAGEDPADVKAQAMLKSAEMPKLAEAGAGVTVSKPPKKQPVENAGKRSGVFERKSASKRNAPYKNSDAPRRDEPKVCILCSCDCEQGVGR